MGQTDRFKTTEYFMYWNLRDRGRRELVRLFTHGILLKLVSQNLKIPKFSVERNRFMSFRTMNIVANIASNERIAKK